MTSRNSILATSILAAISILVGIFPFLPLPTEATGFLIFLGRFHPVLLHFPIVLVLLTIAFESLNWYQERTAGSKSTYQASSLVGPLLLMAFITAVITVIGGYLLYRSGEYQGELVQRHLWGGVGMMLTLNIASYFYLKTRSGTLKVHRQIYRLFLLTAGALVIFTSHLGGTITHGKDFLTEHLPTGQLEPAAVENKSPEELLVFQDLIMPVIEDKCQSCHNQYKTKGGLILTSFESIQKGGKSEKTMLVPELPAESELFNRITLPTDDEDKMPPSEKAPLSEDEVALIHWWIKSGAENEMLLGTAPPDSIRSLLDRFLPKLFQSERVKMKQENELETLEEELATLGTEIGLVIEQDPEYPGFFAASMQIPPATVNNQTISRLKPFANVFSKLSLPGAGIDDDALFDIGKMINLRYLYIPKTSVSGDGLIYLKRLELLERINLSNSQLSNEGILNLIHLPEVKTIYVWGAETDTLVLKALRAYLPEIKILEEEGTYY